MERKEESLEESLSQLLTNITIEINDFGLYTGNKEQVKAVSNDFEMLYFKKVGANAIIGNQQYNCPNQSILILDPNGLNIINNSQEYSYYYVRFDIRPIPLKNQIFSLLTKQGNLIYKEEFRDFKEMFVRLLLEEKEKKMGYRTIISSGVMRVIIEIIRAQKHRAPNMYKIDIIRNQYLHIVDESLKYINDHSMEAIKIEVLARTVGVSTSYLYKAFHKVLKVAPSQYILNYKVVQTKKLLSANYRVNDIARMLGFSSAYHLSKVFKQQTNISPKQYQKSVLKNTD